MTAKSEIRRPNRCVYSVHIRANLTSKLMFPNKIKNDATWMDGCT